MDELNGIFNSDSVFKKAADAFEKAFKTAARGRSEIPPLPGCAGRLKYEVLKAAKEQERSELAAFPDSSEK